MALCFFHPHSVPIPYLVFHRRIPCILVKVFVTSTCCCNALNPVKSHGGFITKFCIVRRPCRRQCENPLGKKNGLQDYRECFLNEYYNSETKTSPVAPSCWCRRRWNIQQYQTSEKTATMTPQSLKYSNIFLHESILLTKCTIFDKQTERGWIAGQLGWHLSHQTSPTRENLRIQRHWQRSKSILFWQVLQALYDVAHFVKTLR